MSECDSVIAEALNIVEALKPLVFPKLAGKGAAVQSVVLIDLLAIWLAGHVVRGDPVATRSLRADLLANALTLVDQLVEIEAKELGT